MFDDRPTAPAADVPDDRPENPERRRLLEAMAVAGAALATGGEALAAMPAGPTAAGDRIDALLRQRVGHVIVIYCENRSFNNLFADFPGLQAPLSAVPADRFRQRDRDGRILSALPPIWKGLAPHRQTLDGQTYQIDEGAIKGVPNTPWTLRTATGEPLPHALVTTSPIHVFYRNQMQIHGGRNDMFVAWGTHGALTMGRYGDAGANFGWWRLARQFTLCDNFFMGAFGGSFLNHQYLITARPPRYPDAALSPAAKRIAVLDDGPEGYRLKLASGSRASAMDGPPKFASHASLTPDFYAVNTFGPPYWPSFNRDPEDPNLAKRGKADILPPQEYATIGDTLSARGVDWAWYGGAWQMAIDGKGRDGISGAFPKSPNFQAHHQPLNYFRQFGPGTEARREHLRDGGTGGTTATNRFLADIAAGRLPAVAFYKPQGNLNMHAGYSSVAAADRHVQDVVRVIQASPIWKDSVVVITVDENGGWWDHVAPPRADRWGPGSRIPALVISPFAKRGHVEHTVYDTGSIQRLLNRRFGLAPLPGITLRDTSMQRASGFRPGDLTECLDLT